MNKQILLVAFEKDVLNSFPITLSLAGHCVRLVSSGLDAIKQARDSSPDLIVLDATLPDMDGSTVQGILHRLPSTMSIPTLLLKPRPHPLMPLNLQLAGIRAGQVQRLNTGELLRQVGDALAICRHLSFQQEMAEMAM